MNLNKFFLLAICTSSCLIAQIDNKPAIRQKIEAQTPQDLYVQEMNIGIAQENQKSVIYALRSLLADNYVLYTKTLNFHWNVEGELFSQLHEFFKNLYEFLQKSNDLLAERIRALGSYSPGSLQEFLALTEIKENRGQKLEYRSMLQILLDDFETIIRNVRNATSLSANNNDWGTNNMLANMLEELEKHAWMIRAHLR
jgi:starvation-inducible DNA-binding protein